MDACAHCGGLFKRKYRSKGLKQTFCSRKCIWAATPQVILICQSCKEPFTVYKKRKNRKFCSRECMVRHPCIVCKKPILGRDKMNGRLRKFCSRRCAAIFNGAGKNYSVVGFAASIKNNGKPMCARCGDDETMHLCVHHIDENHKNNNKENLEVLCANCHYAEHWGNSKNRPSEIDKAGIVAKYWDALFKA